MLLRVRMAVSSLHDVPAETPSRRAKQAIHRRCENQSKGIRRQKAKLQAKVHAQCEGKWLRIWRVVGEHANNSMRRGLQRHARHQMLSQPPLVSVHAHSGRTTGSRARQPLQIGII